MISVLVVNTKGGCGKTTIATNLAGAFAAGHQTILADADPQRSSLGWLRRRPATVAPIAALDWVKDVTDVPPGTERLVIDAPAAMKMKQIEALLRQADAIVLPVLPSAFDEMATRRFLAKLDDLKPIRKNRKPVALVANRLRPRSRAGASLERFLRQFDHPLVAELRDSAAYADLAAAGLGLFDRPSARTAPLLAEWQPLLAYVGQTAEMVDA